MIFNTFAMKRIEREAKLNLLREFIGRAGAVYSSKGNILRRGAFSSSKQAFYVGADKVNVDKMDRIYPDDYSIQLHEGAENEL